MKRAIVPGLGVVALLAVLGAVRPAVAAGPASEPIAERRAVLERLGKTSPFWLGTPAPA